MKDRTLIYSVTIREDTNIVWNEEKKQLELRNSEGELSDKNLVSIGHAYSREGKPPKVLRQAEYLKGLLHLHPKNITTDGYIAIDTSYELFGEKYLCATSCHCIEGNVPKDGNYMKGDSIDILQVPRLIFLAKLGTNPERYGWKRCIEAFIKSPSYRSDKTYSVIVDSDLPDIPKINSLDMEILDDFYLPEGISLQYASADAGNENLQNKLFRQTDKVAKKSLAQAKDEFVLLKSSALSTTFHDLTTYTALVEISV